jgi:hypothetical protein
VAKQVILTRVLGSLRFPAIRVVVIAALLALIP